MYLRRVPRGTRSARAFFEGPDLPKILLFKSGVLDISLANVHN